MNELQFREASDILYQKQAFILRVMLNIIPASENLNLTAFAKKHAINWEIHLSSQASDVFFSPKENICKFKMSLINLFTLFPMWGVNRMGNRWNLRADECHKLPRNQRYPLSPACTPQDVLVCLPLMLRSSLQGKN